MRALRTLAYPLKLASVRIARRAPTALLAAAGVAAGAAMIATVLAGTVVAKDESVGRAIEEIPAVYSQMIRSMITGGYNPDNSPEARNARPFWHILPNRSRKSEAES